MSKKINIAIVSLTIAFSLFWILKDTYINYRFKNNFKIILGKVNRITNVLRQSDNRYVEYEYEIGGQKFVRNNILHMCGSFTDDKLRSMILNKSFPVAYYLNDFKVSTIILTQKDADLFNYKLPDSLLVYDSTLTCKKEMP